MEKMIHPATTIGHVHLIVSNLSRSIRFYCEMIGFQILKQERSIVTLTVDGITPLLVLEEQADAVLKPRGTTGLYHFAILVPDRASLARSLLHLLQKGYPLQGASDHQFSEAVYLADPDGNGIEIYADRPKNEWERTENGEYKGVTKPLDVNGLLAEVGNTPWSGLPSGTRIGHVHLHVANIQEADEFYRNGLGFEATIRMENHALFVSAGGYHHHIGLNTWAGIGAPKPPENAVGLRLFSILLPNQNELKKVAEQLKNIGVTFELAKQTIFVKDPSGNQIQLKVKE
ncbi:VOC family protein [Thermaerobacillus caldiproteolyticus]|uniref:VOC family protein n=1 Tax=Thermaerobacillus caldiproteolyticus TaxID=247480 RepID=UPI002B274800|nr:VOC family protein [Anoxybacillus caldiproteolyticus]